MKLHFKYSIKVIFIVASILSSTTCDKENNDQEEYQSSDYTPSNKTYSEYSSVKYVKTLPIYDNIFAIQGSKILMYTKTENVNIITYNNDDGKVHATNYPFEFYMNQILLKEGNKFFFANYYFPNNLNIYDYDKDSWETIKLDYSQVRRNTAALGNLILFAGGTDTDKNCYYSKVVDIYNITSGKSSKAMLSLPRVDMSSASVGNRVMFAGGFTGIANYAVGDSFVTDRVDIFDAMTGKWSVARLSKPRQWIKAINFANKVYFIGGADAYMRPVNVIDVYDIENNSWVSHDINLSGDDKIHDYYANEKWKASGNLVFFMNTEAFTTKINVFNVLTNQWFSIPVNYYNADFNAIIDSKLYVTYYDSTNTYRYTDIYELK